jgi:hypothetical protein
MKHAIGSIYAISVQAFIAKLTEDQNKIKPRGQETSITHAFVESGRKYDKVNIAIQGLDNTTDVRYFIERKTGDIFGAKSNVAPNFNWYFGNINNCNKWDWTGHHGRNVSDETVIEDSSYAGKRNYIHYKKKEK